MNHSPSAAAAAVSRVPTKPTKGAIMLLLVDPRKANGWTANADALSSCRRILSVTIVGACCERAFLARIQLTFQPYRHRDVIADVANNFR